MQPNGTYHLTIHPRFLEWCSHYYLCTSISYTSHLQLCIVQVSSAETGEKKLTYQHLLIYFKKKLKNKKIIQQPLELFYFRQCIFSFQPASLQWQCVFLGSCTAIWKGFIFLLCLSFALFRFLSTSMVTAAIILSILVWFESCTIQCGLQSRLQATTNL